MNVIARDFLMIVLRLILVPISLMSGALGLGASDKASVWSKDYQPPTELNTPTVHLEPLGPQHAELDHKAFMSSREHLHRTLHWGDWPREDTTVEDNRSDLARHGKEFDNREAYAFTVLSTDRKRCLGCVYMKPLNKHPRAVGIAYWVVEDELVNDLDEHLIKSLLEWFEKDWALDMAVFPLHTDNERGASIAKKLGLRQGGPPRKDMIRFVWQRKQK
jgi:RimJ/RimL family protein N-acetyltransferase